MMATAMAPINDQRWNLLMLRRLARMNCFCKSVGGLASRGWLINQPSAWRSASPVKSLAPDFLRASHSIACSPNLVCWRTQFKSVFKAKFNLAKASSKLTSVKKIKFSLVTASGKMPVSTGSTTTGIMRFPKRSASATSQAQIFDAAEFGLTENTIASASIINLLKRSCQASPGAMSVLSSIG